MKDKKTIKSISRSFLSYILLVGVIIIGTSLMLTSCDSTKAETESQIADVVMKPDEVTLEVVQNADIQLVIADKNGNIDFSAFAVTTSGKQVPIPDNAEIKWWSSDPSVFTVTDNGTATAQGTGEAFCVIKMRRPVGGGIIVPNWDSARVAVF